jgi:outer membrane protein TolC
VAVGVPADLIRRRPDIRRAEREVASQCAQIGVAEAEYYPHFAINGFVGYAATDLNDLFTPKNFTGFILPNVGWNVLNYGRITNNVRVQNAHFQRTVFQYQQTVLTAGREVEDGLVAFLQFQRQAISLETSVTEAAGAVELVDLQYRGGIVDYNRVYTVQTQLVTQQDALASSRGNIALSLIQVYRALGGGWNYFASGGSTHAGAPPQPIPPQPKPGVNAPQKMENLPVPAPATL